jgi:hypothetical protein
LTSGTLKHTWPPGNDERFRNRKGTIPMKKKRILRLAEMIAQVLSQDGPLDMISLHKRLQDKCVYITLKTLNFVLGRMARCGLTRYCEPAPAWGLTTQVRSEFANDWDTTNDKIRNLLAGDGYEGAALEAALQLRLDWIQLLQRNGSMTIASIIDELEAMGWRRDYVVAELGGHVGATDLATEVLGGTRGVRRVATQIYGLLAETNALNDARVNVVFFEFKGRRLLAVNRPGPCEGIMSIEISELGENCGGYARCLAESVLQELTPEERTAASPLTAIDRNSDSAYVGISPPYEIVSLPSRIVEMGELN